MRGRSLSARSRVVVAAIAIGVAGVLAPSPAPTSAASCPATLTVWGDAAYRNPDGIAPRVFCFGTDVPSLNTVPYSADHLCPRAFPYPPLPGTSLKNTSWNDCVSSFKFTANCHYRVRLYEDDGYGTTFRGPWIFPWGSVKVARLTDLGANDQISSIRFAYRATCPRPIET